MRQKTDNKKYGNSNYSINQINTALSKSILEFNNLYGTMDIKTFTKDKKHARIVRDFAREFYEIGRNYDEKYIKNCEYIDWEQLRELRNTCVHYPQNLHDSQLLTKTQNFANDIGKQLVNDMSFDSNYLNNTMTTKFKKTKRDSKINNDPDKTKPIKKQSEQKQMCKMLKVIKDFYIDTGCKKYINLKKDHYSIRLMRDYINELYIMSQSLDIYHKKSSIYIDWNKLRNFRNLCIHETIGINERTELILCKNYVNSISKQFIHDLVYDIGFEKIDFQLQGLSSDIFPDIETTLAEYELEQTNEYIDLD